MLRLTNTVLPMHPDRLYASEGSTQAPYPSARQDVNAHRAWQDKLMHSADEADIIAQLNPNGNCQYQQHGIDTYVLHVYIHERHHPPFTPLTNLIGSHLTLSFDIPSGLSFRHLYITAVHQLDHDGSYGYYRLLAQPITYRLHQHIRGHIDTHLTVQAMVAERTATLDIEIIDDSNNGEDANWSPARMTQWQISDWTHICKRLARQGLTAYLRHEQTDEHSPPKLVITSHSPSDSDGISLNIGALRYQQVLHDRVDAPVLALSEQVITQPNSVTMQRFNSSSVAHPTQSADVAMSRNLDDISHSNNYTLTLDTPAAFAPVTDTETIDEATIVANSHQSQYSIYHALAHATDLNVADTFMLVNHSALNQHYRATHIVHLARNSLAHVTGLTQSSRHQQRHASTLAAGIHLTQLRLITADTPWVGSLYSRRSLPPMTGITEAQSDIDSRNHMTPTRSYLLDSPSQPINRLEAQAGANYGTHFTHRADDQTLMQSIGDSEHLINTGSLLSLTRPSLFATDNEQAVESGYRNTDNGLSEWITDHRTEKAYSQLKVDSAGISASLKMGVINPSDTAKRKGINAATNAQINIKSGEALVLSTQPQTHTQSGQHNYQQHTPTMTQTALGGQHLAERLTQLATGLGRHVNDHKAIKTQLETIAEEQQTKTHQTMPYTLVDSAADSSYVSDDTLIHRSMGEMITTTQQDMMISSGESHNQVSSESLNIIADGQFSMTNAKENITLSAHTGKLEATAKQDVNIASSTKEVEIVATNKITLTAGGASITLDGGDITITAKQFTEKAGKHSKAGGGRDGMGLAGLPDEKILSTLYSIAYKFTDDDGNPLAFVEYEATNLTTGEQISGKTDEHGITERFSSNNPEEIEVYLKLDEDDNVVELHEITDDSI